MVYVGQLINDSNNRLEKKNFFWKKLTPLGAFCFMENSNSYVFCSCATFSDLRIAVYDDGLFGTLVDVLRLPMGVLLRYNKSRPMITLAASVAVRRQPETG